MENYSDYLNRVEPVVDRYDRLEKKAELIKLAINGLNYRVIKLLDEIDASNDEFEKRRLDKELDEVGYDIDKLSEEYYLTIEKLKEL
jgi:hypothetical protein